MRTLLLIIVILLLVGALPTWPYSSGWGYYPSGGVGPANREPACDTQPHEPVGEACVAHIAVNT
jgi:uncharacterized protein DUF3309